VKNGIGFLVLAVSALAQGANYTRFEAYQPMSDGYRKLEELQRLEVTPEDLRKRVQTLTANGMKYEIGRVDIVRTSGVFDVELEVRVTLYDEGVPFTSSGGLKGVTKSPIPISFRMRMDPGTSLPADPCKALGCAPTPLQLKRWYVKAPPPAQGPVAIRGYHYVQSLQVRSVDYDWATGEWTNLVIAETLYEEGQVPNIPNGGGSVGN
jgi:hypothetical protein